MRRRPYTCYTVSEKPFDAYPDYFNGGPAKVAVDEWGVSYTVSPVDKSTILYAYRVPYTGEKHMLYGTTYSSMDEARQAAYEAGLLAFLVYDD